MRPRGVFRRLETPTQKKLDLANVMFARTLGCDHLFELGYIYVDKAGTVQGRDAAAITPDLLQTIEQVRGRTCADHTPASESKYRGRSVRF